MSSVDGHPAVKLSDNPEKSTGMASEIERYLRVFGDAGRVRQAVLVYSAARSACDLRHFHRSVRFPVTHHSVCRRAR